jgi:hypothetical protein
MGLHLCYELAVPRDTSVAEVIERMQRLYREAVTLPFETVGPLVRVTAGETLGDARDADSSLEQWFRFCSRIGLDPRDPVTGARADRLPDAVGFGVKPGDYCEAATFGLAWVPPSNEDGDRLHDEPYIWHWHTVCKTQYASVVSDEHLIRCHTSLVALLDRAPALGFDVTVRDETHYWETRDTGRLLAEVREMNRIVAHFAGALNDAIGEQAHVGGAIFEHREFEELETRDTDASG